MVSKWVAIFLLVVASTLVTTSYTKAKEGVVGLKVVNGSKETEDASVRVRRVVYGGSLTKEQRDKVDRNLGVKERDGDVYKRIELTSDDAEGYLRIDMSGTRLFTSVMVEDNETNQGVRVRIKTPKTVTGVYKDQLINALMTAGVQDIQVVVASGEEVKGVSSILGVYKGYMSSGKELNINRMVLGYNELAMLVRITEDNENVKGYRKEKLSRLMVDVKSVLLDRKMMGRVDGKDEIVEVIEKAMDGNKLRKSLTSEQVDDLQNHIEEYVAVGVMNDTGVDKQINALRKETKIGYIKGIDFMKMAVKARADNIDIKRDFKIFVEDLSDAIKNLWTGIKNRSSKDKEEDIEELDISKEAVEYGGH